MSDQSPVYWTLHKLPSEGMYMVHGVLGHATASIRVPMETTNEDKQLTQRWMSLAEANLIQICLNYQNYAPDERRIKQTLQMLQGDRINRTVRFCGNYIRPNRMGGDKLGNVGMLFAIHDVCRLRILDVSYLGKEVCMTVADFENEYALIHFLDLYNRA